MNSHSIPPDSPAEQQLSRWEHLNYVPLEIGRTGVTSDFVSELVQEIDCADDLTLVMTENKKIRLDESHPADLQNQHHLDSLARSEFYYS